MQIMAKKCQITKLLRLELDQTTFERPLFKNTTSLNTKSCKECPTPGQMQVISPPIPNKIPIIVPYLFKDLNEKLIYLGWGGMGKVCPTVNDNEGDNYGMYNTDCPIGGSDWARRVDTDAHKWTRFDSGGSIGGI